MIEITSLAMEICNDSPIFNNFPPVVICSGLELEFDHSATDAEGHQVFYEFCAPLTAGGTDGATTPGDANGCTGVTPNPAQCSPPFDEVTFRLPDFSATNPLAGDPQVSINSVTGLITGVPQINGQYVVGVCAREIFNGEIMTIVRRDFQFNVTTCEVAVTAQIEPQGEATIVEIEEIIDGIPTPVRTITSCGDEAIDFEHVGPAEDILSYLWVADFGNGNTDTANTRVTQFTFPGPGDYDVLLVTNEGLTCEARDSFPVTIFPALFPDFSFEFDTCVAGEISYTDLSTTAELGQTIERYNWDFDGEATSTDPNPEEEFENPGSRPVTLTIEDNNGCVEEITSIVDYFPAPPILIIRPNIFLGCAPADIFFDNLSFPIDETYDLTWDFGDGSDVATDISPTHTYTETGVFDVSLSVVSPIGCTADTVYRNQITILEKPTADFTFSPEEPNVFNTEVNFFDRSFLAESWQWDFGGLSSSIIQDPTFNFQDTGMFEVQLIVAHLSGCRDTSIQIIDIEPIVTWHMPNAFTPNGDATNDILIGNGFISGLTDFRYTIWNRWGEQVFETTDPFVGWNGTKNNVGANSPLGVYVYDINYTDPRGNPQNLRGHATLIR
jgi:gliding motility-associated-like protein